MENQVSQLSALLTRSRYCLIVASQLLHQNSMKFFMMKNWRFLKHTSINCNELFLLCNTNEHLDALFSATCISKLYTVGCKPVLPSDLKAKRSVILRRCDYQIRNKLEEDIKFEIEKQNSYIRVQDIFKYDSSKNTKVTFENQHMVSQILPKGLVLFNLFHPAHNICRKIFVDIMTCFKCY